MCRDTDCLHHRSYGPIRIFFQTSCSWRSEGLFGQSFSVAPPIQAPPIQALLPGVLLCSSACQSLKGAPWVGSYSVVQCIRHVMGQALYYSAALLACGGREAMVMAPPPMHDSEQYCLASMAAQFSSTGISHHNLLPHLLHPCLPSKQQPSPLDCSTIPKLQLPAAAPSRGPAFLSRVYMTVARTV